MSTGFLHFFAKKPPGRKSGGRAIFLRGASGGFALLVGEQLGSGLADEHGGDHGQQRQRLPLPKFPSHVAACS